MEEIAAADVMRAEILEDARKKAEHILREADEESARGTEEGRARSISESERIALEAEARIARRRAEAEARLPLERLRARTEHVDRALRAATRDFVASLPEPEAARLAAALMARGAPLMAGKGARVKRRGLTRAEAESAAAILGAGAAVEAEEDPSLGGRGLEALSADGATRLRATMDLVEELLLDGRRAELAGALCSEALGLSAAGGKALP
jgi:vacuolar-type H+-ATPase subunit E/Vma4